MSRGWLFVESLSACNFVNTDNGLSSSFSFQKVLCQSSSELFAWGGMFQHEVLGVDSVVCFGVRLQQQIIRLHHKDVCCYQ